MHTSGNDPQANGTAQRKVGHYKVPGIFCTARLDHSYWSYVRYATQSLTRHALQMRQKSLRFGASVVAQVLSHRNVKFPEPRSIIGRLLFWDHFNDQISYVLTPLQDDVSSPIVDRASLPVKLT